MNNLKMEYVYIYIHIHISDLTLWEFGGGLTFPKAQLLTYNLCHIHSTPEILKSLKPAPETPLLDSHFMKPPTTSGLIVAQLRRLPCAVGADASAEKR